MINDERIEEAVRVVRIGKGWTLCVEEGEEWKGGGDAGGLGDWF